MRSAFLIAKREFRAGIATPKTCAIIFFFLLFMGWFFSNFVETFVSLQQRAPMMGGQAPTMEQLLNAMFYNLHFILILIIPAVTMAVFSEEKRSQSIRMLQTAPISTLSIVLGKFFAVCAVMTLVLLLSSVFPWFLISYGNPDFGVVIGSYIGLFLLISSQLAFGMWVSSLTSNQFMAFLFTMLGLFLMLVIDFLAPSISGGGMFENILKYFATTKHLDVFFKGLISVSSVSYFLILTVGFLFFTNVSLDSQRWR